MKKIFIVGILLTTLVFGGCTANNKKEVLTSENLKYSNIDDEATQDKVSQFLYENNIDKNDVDMFMNSVKSYYKSVNGVKLLNEDEKFLILLSKLKGLRIENTEFSIYRKTVFECISLL